jgi:hypothetical protein
LKLELVLSIVAKVVAEFLQRLCGWNGWKKGWHDLCQLFVVQVRHYDFRRKFNPDIKQMPSIVNRMRADIQRKYDEMRKKIENRTPEEKERLYAKAVGETKPKMMAPRHPTGRSGKTEGIAFGTTRRKVFGRGKKRKTRRLPLH